MLRKTNHTYPWPYHRKIHRTWVDHDSRGTRNVVQRPRLEHVLKSANTQRVLRHLQISGTEDYTTFREDALNPIALH